MVESSQQLPKVTRTLNIWMQEASSENAVRKKMNGFAASSQTDHLTTENQIRATVAHGA